MTGQMHLINLNYSRLKVSGERLIVSEQQGSGMRYCKKQQPNNCKPVLEEMVVRSHAR